MAKADSKEQRQASGAPGLVRDNKKHCKKVHHEQEKEQRRKGKEEGEEKPHKEVEGSLKEAVFGWMIISFLILSTVLMISAGKKTSVKTVFD